jgi:hypothetical protein
MDSADVEIDYTNWRGERRRRRVLPLRFFFGATEWRKTPCWQYWAMDLELHEFRYFVMSNVHSWKEIVRDPQPN